MSTVSALSNAVGIFRYFQTGVTYRYGQVGFWFGLY